MRSRRVVHVDEHMIANVIVLGSMTTSSDTVNLRGGRSVKKSTLKNARFLNVFPRLDGYPRTMDDEGESASHRTH